MLLHACTPASTTGSFVGGPLVRSQPVASPSDITTSIFAPARKLTAIAVAGGDVYFATSNSVLKVRGHRARFVAKHLSGPRGLAVDQAGNVWVADTGHHTVRKIAPDGTSTSYGGFGSPWGIAVGAAGVVYVSDFGFGLVREIAADGRVTTIASGLNAPRGIARTSNGTLYVGGYTAGDSHRGYIDAISSKGKVTQLDGIGDILPEGLAQARGHLYVGQANAHSIYELLDGAFVAVGSGFASPQNVAVGPDEAVYVADPVRQQIFEVARGGQVRPFSAGFSEASDIAYDASEGRLYVADYGSGSVYRVAPDGTATTLTTGLQGIWGIAVDSAHDVYVSDSDTVRRITPAGVVSTFGAGYKRPFYLAMDPSGNLLVVDQWAGCIWRVKPDGTKTAAVTGLSYPAGVAADAQGNLYYVDTVKDSFVNKVAPDGTVTTLLAGLTFPMGLAVDASGNLYVAANDDFTVYRIAPSGIVQSLGNGFPQPDGVAVDTRGTVYVSSQRSSTLFTFKQVQR